MLLPLDVIMAMGGNSVFKTILNLVVVLVKLRIQFNSLVLFQRIILALLLGHFGSCSSLVQGQHNCSVQFRRILRTRKRHSGFNCGYALSVVTHTIFIIISQYVSREVFSVPLLDSTLRQEKLSLHIWHNIYTAITGFELSKKFEYQSLLHII